MAPFFYYKKENISIARAHATLHRQYPVKAQVCLVYALRCQIIFPFVFSFFFQFM
jgi:hypothetical protein